MFSWIHNVELVGARLAPLPVRMEMVVHNENELIEVVLEELCNVHVNVQVVLDAIPFGKRIVVDYVELPLPEVHCCKLRLGSCASAKMIVTRL